MIYTFWFSRPMASGHIHQLDLAIMASILFVLCVGVVGRSSVMGVFLISRAMAVLRYAMLRFHLMRGICIYMV